MANASLENDQHNTELGNGSRLAFGPLQIGWPNYWLLVVAIVGQIATVWITWEVWQVREYPPNMPVFDVPEWSFGIWVIVSLAYMLVDPKRGFWLHVGVVFVASLFDQFRMQPQFLAMIFLMLATIWDWGKAVCRWFLVSVWLWAGLHKLLSTHWFAHASFWILTYLDIPEGQANSIHWYFALSVGLAELLVGVAAIFKPKIAAVLCVLMHCSIFVLLCVINWNVSVLPWNLATAIVGFWVMWTLSRSGPMANTDVNRWATSRVFNFALALLFLVPPAGFYYGLLDHGYASVLYSDFVPRGLITTSDRVEKITGWDPVHVPFPNERRTIRQYFELVAKDGDKLHLFEPRPSLESQYFCFRDGRAQLISEAEFFAENEDGVSGVAMNDPRAFFRLKRLGKLLARPYKGVERADRHSRVVYAFALRPENYSLQTLEMLQGLPNLTQLQLADCPVNDDDLKYVSGLTNLVGIGLNNTNVTDEGLQHLESLPKLKLLEVENTKISVDGMNRLKTKLGM